MGDQLWMARYLLYRVAEIYGVLVTLDPKPTVTSGLIELVSHNLINCLFMLLAVCVLALVTFAAFETEKCESLLVVCIEKDPFVRLICITTNK